MITFQQLRSAVPGAEPASLDPGQVAFNVSDGTMYLGTGSNQRVNFSGEVVLPNPPAGKGWVQVLLERSALNEFFLENPVSEGRPAPQNEQVLTWNSDLGVPEWQNAGTGSAYVTTNAAVFSSPGLTTSDKITAAIGSPTDIGENASCIVSGDPGSLYEGLYIYNDGGWAFAAHFAFNTSEQVPATNPMTSLPQSVQEVLDALKAVDDDLQDQINAGGADISALQGDVAQLQTDVAQLDANKLDKADNNPVVGQILSFDGTGQHWINSPAATAVDSVTGTLPIDVDNTDPNNPIVGILAASTGNPGAVQLDDTVTSTSVSRAATANAVKTAYDAADAAQMSADAANTTANAALPKAGGTMTGNLTFANTANIVDGMGNAGASGQVLSSDGTTVEWVNSIPGTVLGITATAPITVDNTDPQNPILGVNEATNATTGVVQVGDNIQLAAGVISVNDSSTTQKGIVELVDTLNSSSTTSALTARAGADLQSQINALASASNLVLAGGYDASTGTMQSVTAAGTAEGFVVGNALPAPAAGNNDYYVIVTVAGTNPEACNNGDWFLSDGTNWVHLAVGPVPQAASYTQAGTVQLANQAALYAGTSDNTAVTPDAVYANMSDSVTLSDSHIIASATAVKTAYDMAVTADTAASAAQADATQALADAAAAQADATQALSDAAAAQATANAAIPKATFTAAGQLLYSTGNGTYAVLPPGNPGEVLQCNGSAPPTWVLPAVVNYSSTKSIDAGVPVPLLSWTAGTRLGTLVISGKSSLGELAWANITVSASAGVGSSVITTSYGNFGELSLVPSGPGFQVVFTPTVTRASADFFFQYSATFGDQPTVL